MVYDSLGMNGASITVLSRSSIASSGLPNCAPGTEPHDHQLRNQRSGLRVLREGTYEKEVREAVRRVQAAVPDASLMLMSPMDRGERTGLDEIQTMETIPKSWRFRRGSPRTRDARSSIPSKLWAARGPWPAGTTVRGGLVSADLIHPSRPAVASLPTPS